MAALSVSRWRIPNTRLAKDIRRSPYRATLHAPDLARIFRDGAIARKLPGGRHVQDGLARPLLRMSVEFTHALLRLDVGRQIREVHVVISVLQKRVAERLEETGLIAVEVIRKDQIQSSTNLGLVFVMPARAVPRPAGQHLLRGKTEQKECVLASLLRHLDRCTIACADCQRSVH